MSLVKIFLRSISWVGCHLRTGLVIAAWKDIAIRLIENSEPSQSPKRPTLGERKWDRLFFWEKRKGDKNHFVVRGGPAASSPTLMILAQRWTRLV